MSNNIITKRMENTEEQELGGSTIAKFNPFSLLLLVSALFIELYLIGKYLGRDPYANYSILLFTLGFIPIPGLYLLNDKDILDRETKFTKDLWETIKLFGYSFLVFGFLAVIQVLTQLSFRLALSTTDLYFYFLAAGIIEEAFFRMFLLRVFMKYLRSPWGKIVGTIISSVFFMFAHLGAYGTTLPVLLSMLFFGIFLCITYLSFKDITPNMLGHMGYNLYAIGTLLMRI